MLRSKPTRTTLFCLVLAGTFACGELDTGTSVRGSAIVDAGAPDSGSHPKDAGVPDAGGPPPADGGIADAGVPPSGCTRTQGYWKNHPAAWPVTSITLGSNTYTAAQALSILNTPPRGNGLLILAHQLIAAKLNVASGADSSSISATIAAADALIGSLIIPPIGNGFLAPSTASPLSTLLDQFNNGRLGPPHCR